MKNKQKTLQNLSKGFWVLLLDYYIKNHHKSDSKGMCGIVYDMCCGGLISGKLGRRFGKYIRKEFSDQEVFYDWRGYKVIGFTFLWRPDRIQPRLDYIQSKIKSYETKTN